MPQRHIPFACHRRLVDGASGFQVLSFLDAYSGYNQIRMHPLDEEKTTFITKDVNFSYEVMPFDLKNAGATYQWLMDQAFKQQIKQNVEVYMDGMVVRSQSIPQHVVDLEEVFGELHKYNMHLNPDKCTFGVGDDKFFGFMITHLLVWKREKFCIWTHLSWYFLYESSCSKSVSVFQLSLH